MLTRMIIGKAKIKVSQNQLYMLGLPTKIGRFSDHIHTLQHSHHSTDIQTDRLIDEVDDERMHDGLMD